MEASSLRPAAARPAPLLAGSALLRLKGDEQLVTLVRRGHDGAFEVLFRRYQPRLLAFCRHMLSSTEDAEDVLQESFASAHRAILADERPIVARAWLYRIARNRCLDHLRRPMRADGQDSMDVFERRGGVTSEDLAQERAKIRDVMGDIRALPESQRSALLMREIDTLSHEQIAAAMDTTVSGVKSLLVRARIALTEAARARSLTCDEVRVSLAEAAEGIAKAPPEARRHLKSCQPCQRFKRDLRRTTRVLAAAWPLEPLSLARDLFGGSGAAAAASTSAAPTTAAAVACGGSLAAKGVAGGLVAKAVAGVAATAVATGGAVELDRRVTAPDRAPVSSAIERTTPLRAQAPRSPVSSARARVAVTDRRPSQALATPSPVAPRSPSAPRAARRARSPRERLDSGRSAAPAALGPRREGDAIARRPPRPIAADGSRRRADRVRRPADPTRRKATARPRRGAIRRPRSAPRRAQAVSGSRPIDRRTRPRAAAAPRRLGGARRRADVHRRRDIARPVSFEAISTNSSQEGP